MLGCFGFGRPAQRAEGRGSGLSRPQSGRLRERSGDSGPVTLFLLNLALLLIGGTAASADETELSSIEPMVDPFQDQSIVFFWSGESSTQIPYRMRWKDCTVGSDRTGDVHPSFPAPLLQMGGCPRGERCLRSEGRSGLVFDNPFEEVLDDQSPFSLSAWIRFESWQNNAAWFVLGDLAEDGVALLANHYQTVSTERQAGFAWTHDLAQGKTIYSDTDGVENGAGLACENNPDAVSPAGPRCSCDLRPATDYFAVCRVWIDQGPAEDRRDCTIYDDGRRQVCRWDSAWRTNDDVLPDVQLDFIGLGNLSQATDATMLLDNFAISRDVDFDHLTRLFDAQRAPFWACK